MNDDNKTPLAYQFRVRMQELVDMALGDGTIEAGDWDPVTLGYAVFGGDSLLQQNPALVADIVGYRFGGVGITNDDLFAVLRGMEDRMANDEFNREYAW